MISRHSKRDNCFRTLTNGRPKIVATYDYTDEAGVLLFQVVRFEPGFDGELKTFRQRRPDGNGGWTWGLAGLQPVLYRLPEVLQAPCEKSIFIPEGEKDVDNLRALEMVATTNPMGAGKWRIEYGEALRGRNVVILPDNDEPGRKHAQAVANSLRGVAASVVILELPGLPPKGDVSDWLQIEGNDKVKLLQLVYGALRAQANHQNSQADCMSDGGKSGEGSRSQSRKSAATLLVEIVLESGAELFRTPEQTAYATVPLDGHRETWPLHSTGFRRWLSHRFHAQCRKAPGSQAVASAAAVLEGRALFEGPERAVHVRLAENNGRIYLDLADSKWRAVEVDATGWRVVNNPPAWFRRPRGMLALPTPQAGGHLEELRQFVNVASEEDWCLLVAWLIQALRPSGPYPILCHHGEQGSAKSTSARVARALVDPNSAPLRSAPRDDRDLIIAANNGWVVAYDNLSHLSDWLSDALCRLATGGGYATRELYTNDEEALFDAMRPCLLTSIEDLATRGDQLERSIIRRLPSISDSERRTERNFWAAFDGARPRILGALLDAVSGALRELPNVHLTGRPRMADFAEWVTAAERALGWKPGTFLAAYDSSREDANELALDASVLVGPLRQFVGQQGLWKGTASDLLRELDKVAGEPTVKSKEWPKRPHVLSGRLRRLAPNLRQVGLFVEFERELGSQRQRIIQLTLERTQEEECNEASEASEASQDSKKPKESDEGAGRSGTLGSVPPDASKEQDSPEGTRRDAWDAPSRRVADEGF